MLIYVYISSYNMVKYIQDNVCTVMANYLGTHQSAILVFIS